MGNTKSAAKISTESGENELEQQQQPKKNASSKQKKKKSSKKAKDAPAAEAAATENGTSVDTPQNPETSAGKDSAGPAEEGEIAKEEKTESTEGEIEGVGEKEKETGGEVGRVEAEVDVEEGIEGREANKEDIPKKSEGEQNGREVLLASASEDKSEEVIMKEDDDGPKEEDRSLSGASDGKEAPESACPVLEETVAVDDGQQASEAAVEVAATSEENGDRASDSSVSAVAAVEEVGGSHDLTQDAQDEEPVIASVSNGAPVSNDDDTPDECYSYRPRLCHLCKWADFDGYGFNLHADKEKPGQYIGSVDPDSPAETGGLKEHDRIIEVNGENIESQTHTVVIQKIKAGGDRTSMLVVDPSSDEYYKGRGITVTSSIPSTLVISTPPRGGGEDMTDNATAAATVLVTSQEPEVDHSYTEQSYQYQFDEHVEAEDSRGVEAYPQPLPEPNVSLSDEEAEGTVTAVVSETVESYPPPEPEAVANGTEEEEERERMQQAEAEAAAAALLVPQVEDDVVVAEAFDAAVTVDDDGDVVVAAAPDDAEEQQQFEQEDVVSGGKVDDNAYEEMDVTATVVTTTSYEPDFGASNGINGGTVDYEPAPEPTPVITPEPQPKEPEPTPEPEPAVIRSTVTTTPIAKDKEDPVPKMTVAQMKEQLKARKKQDPRNQKTSFSDKHKLFEKM